MLQSDDHSLQNLKQFEEAARTCHNKDWRVEMKNTHADLLAAINSFWREPTAAKLTEINSLWAHAHHLYDAAPPTRDPQPPLAGAPEAARLAA
jgi:hypothetical protein